MYKSNLVVTLLSEQRPLKISDSSRLKLLNAKGNFTATAKNIK